MQHLIEKLLIEDSIESRWLRFTYIWLILPMVNIDGVFVGNSRRDITGYDLNRAWNNPKKVSNSLLHNQ